MDIDQQQLDRLAEGIALRLGREAARLIDEGELGVRLGIAQRTVRDLVARGELPQPLRVGGLNRWRWQTVLAHLEARSSKPRRRGRGKYSRNGSASREDA